MSPSVRQARWFLRVLALAALFVALFTTGAGYADESADVVLNHNVDHAVSDIGDTVIYEAFVVNMSGTTTARNVVVSEALPANVTLQSATTTAGACAGTTCSVGDLEPDGTAKLVFYVRMEQPGLARAVATVTQSTADPDPANNSAIADSTVLTPFAGVRLQPGTLKVARHRVVRVRVACPADAVVACVGQLTVKSARRLRAYGHHFERVTMLATSFKLDPGAQKDVGASVARGLMRFVPRRRALPVTVSAVSVDARRTVRTATVKARLKR
jgi:uncharacterized repeat protein (TIGR01451 family)